MNLRRGLSFLCQPSARWSFGGLILIGITIGVLTTITFNVVLHATNTEKFCVSCHEMRQYPYVMLQNTSHFNNRIGVHVECADCHVPKEFFPKMVRKIQASREVWGHLWGTLNTPEKYAAHVPVMKAREIARMRANDSKECRHCHSVEHMIASMQTAKAQEYHQAEQKENKTCIDCHAGIAHTPAGEVHEAKTEI